MNKKQLLKAAIQYAADVAKWVKEVRKWANKSTTLDEGPGSNPPPPPPPPTGFEQP